MSIFNAGAVTGTLGLNISEYTEGMLGAEALAEIFPSIVTSFLADPLLGLIDVAKEAAEGVMDAVNEIGNGTAQMSLMAEKSGESVESFSRLAAAAKSVGVDSQSLAMGMEMLGRNAAQAVDGNKTAEKSFNDLGISAQFLKDNLNDQAAIFAAVQSGMDKLGSTGERLAAAQALMSRGGKELLPLFDLGAEGANKFADSMEALGATETSASAGTGRKFLQLQTIVEGAWEGIKKAVAEPILDALGENMDSILPKITAVTTWLRDGIGEAMKVIIPIAQTVWSVLEPIGEILGDILLPVMQILLPVIQGVGLALQVVADIIDGILNPLETVISGFEDLFSTGDIAVGGAGGSGGRGNITIQNLNVDGLDEESATSQIAAKIAPVIHAAHQKQHNALQAAASSRKVAKTLGGRS